jgi:tetratricopeptide (TPR) repeat protein
MKTLALILFLAAGIVLAPAQTLLLKNGQSMAADDLKRDGDMLTVMIKTPNGGSGRVGFQVEDVASLDLPAPDGFAEAQQLASQGQYDHALTEIEPILAYQKTIQDVPGNWWAHAALVKASSLAGLNRDDEARALLTEISANSTDIVVLSRVKLQVALLTKLKDPQEAIDTIDAAVGQIKDPDTLTRACIAEGNIHLSQHESDSALLDYLTVVVFYPEHNPLLGKALLGAGRAYANLKDFTNATKIFEKVITTYPDSPEADSSKTELSKIQKT